MKKRRIEIKKINLKNLFNKKENVAILALTIVFCTGMIITVIKDDSIPKHDGDVLVDSINVVSEEETAASQGVNFEGKRAKVDLERNEIIAKLDETINNTKSDNEKDTMIEMKAELIGNMKKELEIETLIESKKLPDTFILITDRNIKATVDTSELKQAEVNKLCNLIMEETGLGAEKIIIQSAY